MRYEAEVYVRTDIPEATLQTDDLLEAKGWVAEQIAKDGSGVLKGCVSENGIEILNTEDGINWETS